MSKLSEGEVRIEDDGRTYCARYRAADGIVSVESAFGTKAMPAGDHSAEDVARFILRGLIAGETKQLD